MAPSPAASTALVFSAHPQLGLAAKSSLAAGLAWLLVQPFGGVADDYPYYAPLGAVVAVSTTVSGSARTTLQALVSIGLGAALGALAGVAPVPTVVGLVVVVAVAGLMAGWHRLGLSGSWVPVSALFVLVLGGGDPTHYLGGYLGLTTLGMLVGTAVNLALPQTVLAPAGEAEHRLRAALADQLDDLADGLLADEAPDAADWRRRRRGSARWRTRRGSWSIARWSPGGATGAHAAARRRRSRPTTRRALSSVSRLWWESSSSSSATGSRASARPSHSDRSCDRRRRGRCRPPPSWCATRSTPTDPRRPPTRDARRPRPRSPTSPAPYDGRAPSPAPGCGPPPPS